MVNIATAHPTIKNFKKYVNPYESTITYDRIVNSIGIYEHIEITVTHGAGSENTKMVVSTTDHYGVETVRTYTAEELKIIQQFLNRPEIAFELPGGLS